MSYFPEKLKGFKNIIDEFDTEKEYIDVVSVYDVSYVKCELFHDITNEHLMITIKK